MSKLSNSVTRLSYSQTFVMSNKARELAKKGIDVISLTLGEPDYDVPEFVKNAAKKAMDEGFNSYTPVSGYIELRQAVANKFRRDNHLSYELSEVMISNGAKQCIMNVLMALINEGDEVILPSPYWVSYYEMVKLVGGKNIIIKTTIENDFKITAEQLEQAITKNTKVFLFSSPCNPSGSVYSREELFKLVQVFKKYPRIIIISDEIYEYINYKFKHVSIAEFSEIFDQTVVVNGMSKSFAMTGWRVGYMGGPKWIIEACDKIQGQTTSGSNCVAQRASIVALEADSSEIQFMINSFEKRRNLVYNLLKNIPGFQTNLPSGAFYFFPNISYYFGKTIKGYTINNSDEFSNFLLNFAHVATVGGLSFGDRNCIRLSYATEENKLIKAIKRIQNVVSF